MNATNTTAPANVNMGVAEDPNAALKALIATMPVGSPARVQAEQILADNEKLKAEAKAKKFGGTFGMKVSEKGCVSVYGHGRFPTSLYEEQWTKLIGTGIDGDDGKIHEIRAFIVAEKAKGTLKSDPESVAASKKAAGERTTAALKDLEAKKAKTAGK